MPRAAGDSPSPLPSPSPVPTRTRKCVYDAICGHTREGVSLCAQGRSRQSSPPPFPLPLSPPVRVSREVCVEVTKGRERVCVHRAIGDSQATGVRLLPPHVLIRKATPTTEQVATQTHTHTHTESADTNQIR